MNSGLAKAGEFNEWLNYDAIVLKKKISKVLRSYSNYCW